MPLRKEATEEKDKGERKVLTEVEHESLFSNMEILLR